MITVMSSWSDHIDLDRQCNGIPYHALSSPQNSSINKMRACCRLRAHGPSLYFSS